MNDLLAHQLFTILFRLNILLIVGFVLVGVFVKDFRKEALLWVLGLGTTAWLINLLSELK